MNTLSDASTALATLGVPHRAAVLDDDLLVVRCKRARFLTADELVSLLVFAGEVAATRISLYIDGICFSFPYLAYIDMLLSGSSFESFVRTWDVASGDYRYPNL